MPFEYLDIPRLATNAARAYVPRLQDSAIAEFSQRISEEVARGLWIQDGPNAIGPEGRNIEEYVEHLVSTRPHWLVPAVETSEDVDNVWTSGSLTKQGERFRELRRFLGNDKAANAALAEEAALYGTTPGSTKPGVKPGPVDEKAKAKADQANNAYSPAFKGDRSAKIASMIKGMGAKTVAEIAAAAGCRIDGSPLRKGK
ncbi:hypothetical protein HU230_0036760 [Bradyrhizobium quebecense]|uniref:Uncharacterized protein n=1 Tax=Bradyrhizobium quebecense TaxID=2748629 RepID=A0A973WXB3_9BRAD|nr:hypothetical protein [Bradyrhizobium quebecense]UGA43741.1 hypothetical protein HU230_0036760 [Bradyrhizobium quebecense]